jgi:hypothetical protein
MAVMAVMAVLGGLCALVVVALAYVVGRLSVEVRRLTAELATLSDGPGEPATPAAATESMDPGPRTPTPVTAPIANEATSAALDSDVQVITAWPDADDDLDITARRVASVTLARPLIKVASISYGLRRALDDEHRFKVRSAMRQEFRRQRKMRRRRRAGRAPSMGWRS